LCVRGVGVDAAGGDARRRAGARRPQRHLPRDREDARRGAIPSPGATRRAHRAAAPRRLAGLRPALGRPRRACRGRTSPRSRPDLGAGSRLAPTGRARGGARRLARRPWCGLGRGRQDRPPRLCPERPQLFVLRLLGPAL
jgi:hypothetical protein